MFTKVYLYIGSNNETKELELLKIESIISDNFEGFTLYEVVGYWQRSKEKTAKIELVLENEGDKTKLLRMVKLLKKELKQDAILVETFQSNSIFI